MCLEANNWWSQGYSYVDWNEVERLGSQCEHIAL
jgi:hypothetical protein